MIRTITHTIRELPTGWLHKEWGVTYPTATHATRAIASHERQIIARTPANAVVSHRVWEPTTPAGTVTRKPISVAICTAARMRLALPSFSGTALPNNAEANRMAAVPVKMAELTNSAGRNAVVHKGIFVLLSTTPV